MKIYFSYDFFYLDRPTLSFLQAIDEKRRYKNEHPYPQMFVHSARFVSLLSIFGTYLRSFCQIKQLLILYLVDTYFGVLVKWKGWKQVQGSYNVVKRGIK